MTVADARAAADAGADFIGIMFATQSRRRVAVEEAALIAAAAGAPMPQIEQEDPPPLHPGRFPSVEDWFTHGAQALDRLLARKHPLVVGVFADQPVDEVNEIAEEVGLDLVQFSGDEPWQQCLLSTRQAIKVVRPRSTAEILRSELRSGSAIAVMLDGSRGTGTVGDWSVAAEVASWVPLWLAGGLAPDNVEEAIRVVRPWAVDVSSGVETNGAKDPQKIAAFVRAAKGVVV
jgi:phosphoribosylanthranilate isomerase